MVLLIGVGFVEEISQFRRTVVFGIATGHVDEVGHVDGFDGIGVNRDEEATDGEGRKTHD